MLRNVLTQKIHTQKEFNRMNILKKKKHHSAVPFSHSDPVCDEETLPEGFSGQYEEQRGDPRAAGHI